MLEIIIALVVLMLIMVMYKKRKTKCACAPKRMSVADPFRTETSLLELEANPRSFAKDGLPDIVGNMWNVEGSLPEIDGKGRYRTTSNLDFETPTWNRYSMTKACAGRGLSHMAKVRSPTKDVVLS
jgi:hypothetical protein